MASKTKADLNALIPLLVELLHNNDHDIGESYLDRDTDGWGRFNDYTVNSLCYEEDGWCIEITYKCCGEWERDSGDYWTPPSCELVKAWGEVTELSAVYYDEETEEGKEFSVNDLKKLRTALNKELKNIA